MPKVQAHDSTAGRAIQKKAWQDHVLPRHRGNMVKLKKESIGLVMFGKDNDLSNNGSELKPTPVGLKPVKGPRINPYSLVARHNPSLLLFATEGPSQLGIRLNVDHRHYK